MAGSQNAFVSLQNNEFVGGDEVGVRYWQQKLEAVRDFFLPKRYEFLSRHYLNVNRW